MPDTSKSLTLSPVATPVDGTAAEEPAAFVPAGPVVAASGVTFRFQDGSGALDAVTLVQEVAWPRSGPALANVGGGVWEVEFERPPVDRMEYRFETVSGGDRRLLLDPANPLTAPGAFGDRSVIEFPEYVAPAWLSVEAPAGQVQELDLPSSILGADQPTLLWSAIGSDPSTPLPLLVALDGLEFARFSQLLRMLDVQVSQGELPPMRALLMHPVRRDQDYTASPEFAAALATEIVPQLAEAVAIPEERQFRVGLGASLGGLAMMHAHREQPDLFGALFLQSSSFLHSGDLGAAPLQRVQAFVNEVLVAGAWRSPIPIVMTCGTVEQNLSNNRDTVAVLCEQGYPAELYVNLDAHNWIGWRDAWTPHLVGLLREVWQ
ncbi:MAG TPA: alpha/beta hydrolase-fold protein [Acidimicrobiales bacterium]|nr:alpha/beta hydrolase-fold protein [Acidimicrobiales bacterium]